MSKVLTASNANFYELVRAIKSKFNENVLCVKWENEDNFYLIINLSKAFIDLIKGMFYKPSSDLFLKHRGKSEFFLILEKNTFLCHRCKLEKMIGLLDINIRKNSYVMAYMLFDQDSSSFIPEKKNKNEKEKSMDFSSKLDLQILHQITSPDTKGSSDIDSIDIKADSSKRLIVCECEISKPCIKNKACSSFKSEHIQNRISKRTVYLTEKLKELSKSICRSRKAKSCQPRKPEDSSNNNSNNIVCLNETQFQQRIQLYQILKLYPLIGENGDQPLIPDENNANGTARRSPQGPSSTDVQVMSLQEAIARMTTHPYVSSGQNNVRSDTLEDERHSYDMPDSYSENNHDPMEYEEYAHTTILDQPVSHGGTLSTRLDVGVSQDNSKSEIRVPVTENRFPQPALGQQSGPYSSSAQHLQNRQEYSDTTFAEPVTPQTVTRQHNRNDDLLRVLGRVRSPHYADPAARLDTFLRWPSDIAQTPHQVAEAGFYYTGFQDIVRCFVCDGGLKNWDPDDDPWIEHARWFPQCGYVRLEKGEEFINLVRMMTEEEEDPTVHAGATWQRTETSNINADSAASNEITEPSVLEQEDAQNVIEMGYAEKDVAMAINDIFKKGRQYFTGQEIAEIILEKQMRGELKDSKLATDSPSSIGNTSTATGPAISQNKHLKELLQCTECKSRQRNILFLPCTHHVVCESCSRDLHICTCCYRKIKEKVRTYMS